MELNAKIKTTNNKDIQDPETAQKIEILIQKTHNITIPSIIFEYLSNENIDFEINDLKVFYSQFGEVVDFVIKGKLSIALFKTFFSANVCREFLLNENNFKENMKKNFDVRWFNYEKDMSNLPIEMEKLFEEIHKKNLKNITTNKLINKNKLSMVSNSNSSGEDSQDEIINNIVQPSVPQNNINNINTSNYFSLNMMMQYNQLNINPNMNINNINNNLNQMNNYNLMANLMINPHTMNMQNMSQLFMNQNMGVNNMNNMMNMQINNHQNYQNKNFNPNNEEKNYGKYTCKYEILIPNDKDFQVARRLIGSKGCNMKKILNQCKSGNNVNDNVKLRLRGKGSGYKEGPQNKESDEQLHLCISAKNQEEMKKACGLVDELLNKIFDEYKKYCIKNNIMPVTTQIANRIDCGNSLHKIK